MNRESETFELKTSGIPQAGLGVFAKTDIAAGSYLNLKPRNATIGVLRTRAEIPDEFISYCIAKEEDSYLCPVDFNNMELVWYLNHSATPNAEPRPDGYYATEDIRSGEEILINYNSLNEPEEKKEDFYKH